MPALKIAARTDVGQTRSTHEDAFTVIDAQNGVLPSWCSAVLAVFDGAGGMPHGDVASSRAVHYLQEMIAKPPFTDASPETLESVMQDLLLALHAQLLADAQTEPDLQGMATTITLAVYVSGAPLTAWLATVGDSPAFLFRDGRIEKLSQDDSFVSELVRRGDVTPDKIEGHPWSHVMTQVLGFEGDIQPHVSVHGLQSGDQLLLCTDGLTNAVAEKGIVKILNDAPDPESACIQLVDAANAAGGPDNVTVVVASVAD